MAIFTIVAAHPVDVQSHELPRVRVDSFLIEADTMPAAFGHVAEYEGIVGAAEVFGIRNSGPVIVTPSCTHRREEQLDQWQNWSRMVRRGKLPWQLLAEGSESLQQRQDRLFAERYPHLA